MTSKPLFIGNWKMHFLPADIADYVAQFRTLLDSPLLDQAHVAIAAPAPLLGLLSEALSIGKSKIAVAAQNVHWEDFGAHTGEISPQLLKALNVRYSLVGHSERRQFYGETDETVAKRTAAAIRSGLIPVLCVGESEQEYREGRSHEVAFNQLKAGIALITENDAAGLVVAYEPVWAIGTGLTATPKHAEKQHRVVREVLVETFGNAGSTVSILYGGSTKPDNIAELLSVINVDGALTGGSSLKPEVFAALITEGCEAFYKK